MKVYEIYYYNWYCDDGVYYIVSARTPEEAETKFLSTHILNKKDFVKVEEIDIAEPHFVA